MTFKTFISLVPACLSAISCTHLHDGGEKREIVFEVTVASNTRAAGNDGLRLPENEDIAVQGYSLPSDAPWASAKDEARMEMDNVRAVHSEGDIWVPEEKYEWPENGRNMSFFAYLPCGRGEFSRDGTITVSGYSVSEGAGLMFCSATDCGYNTLGHVSLKFTRALCSVEFHIQSSLKTGNTARISGLDISGLSACGDFHSRPLPSWIPDGVPQDFIFFEGETFTGDSAEDPTATVLLNFNHALSAIVININNVSRDYFRLSSCRLEGTATTARLEIGRDAGVAVSDYSGADNPSYGINEINATIDKGESLTLYKGSGSADGSGSLLVWPQNLQGRKLVLNYFDSEDTPWTREVDIPLESSSLSNWLPGRRYAYNVNLADENIYVTFSIVPWTVNDVIIN